MRCKLCRDCCVESFSVCVFLSTAPQVVLAYSGGLDTSVILKWLQDTYDCEVVTFTADLGQVPLLSYLCDASNRQRRCVRWESCERWCTSRCVINESVQQLASHNCRPRMCTTANRLALHRWTPCCTPEWASVHRNEHWQGAWCRARSWRRCAARRSSLA